MTVPYTFANRTGNIPLSELDANFSNVSAFSSTAGTVTTAAQPNIASVGTLSSLTVSGGISGSSLTVSGGISGSSLTVTGNITGGNIIGTVIGNISNAVYADTAGTVTTNAQPNITSVGTLTSLTVTANISTNGDLVAIGNVVSAGNITSGGNINAAANIVANGSLISIGNISGSNLITSGNVDSGNILSLGLIRGTTVLATGNLVGGNANISTSVNTLTLNSANVITQSVSTNTVSAAGNVSVGGILSSPLKTKASNDPGTVGEICWDSAYIYVCIAGNTWARAGLIGGY